MFSVKSRRSAGIPVTPAVHRVLAQGNAARDRQDWPQAAAAYRQALKSAPDLAHIWIQLGNMEKEQGLREAAEFAYMQAIDIHPHDAEPLLQLGHLFKLQNEQTKAGQYYLRAFQADPRLIDAATELHRTIARARGERRQHLIEALRATLADVPDSEAIDTRSPPKGADTSNGQPYLVFDVSDLIGYFAHGRSPTGIQRVQIEVISHALLRQDGNISICCFTDGRDDWFQVPTGIFRRTVALSLKSSDRNDADWVTALHQLHLHLALSHPFAFPRGAYLINLGSSWQLHNYFLFVRDAKARYGIRYVPFVHDLIPIVAPEHFTRSARQEVVPWVAGVFSHADHILVNSEATRKDLLQTGEILGRQFDTKDIAVIRLDADFRAAQRDPASGPLPAGGLARWQLAGKAFVLFVATVESRKGHGTAFDAWAELIERHGPNNIPMLVCVGKRGWLSTKVYQRLALDATLASCVRMLSAISDADLSLLYAHCLFTIYPSLYEGWGLPITESLCYAKPVIASNTSSLPEAGGDFAVYVEANSTRSLAAAVERMWLDVEYRESIRSRIETQFRPRSWGDLAGQINTVLSEMAERDRGIVTATPVSVARMGAYHPIARSTAARIWHGYGVGEIFRTGTGWSAPDIDGSWTSLRGGALAIGLLPFDGTVRVGLLLLGASECDVDWTLRVDRGPTLSGTLARRGRKWIMFNCPVEKTDNALRLDLRSKPGEVESGQDERDYDGSSTIGLAGFFLHELDDAAAAMRLLEAAAFGNLDDLDAYREIASS